MTPDRAVLRQLPLDVAMRCRALPVAREGSRITVAMADPSDHAARQALTVALRRSPVADPAHQIILVQGDAAQIDAWLAELATASNEWADQPMHIWLREPAPGDMAGVTGYAAQVAGLLSASLHRFDPLNPGSSGPDRTAFSGRTLVILPCCTADAPVSLLAGEASMGPSQVQDGPVPTLYACRPRWPLRRLLLIVRGDPVDAAAQDWAARLARASGAAATALMVAPHSPATYTPPVHDDVSSLLSANSAMGHKMQGAMQSLAAMQLDAVLHLRQGAPPVVIREELASTSYDLVVAGVAIRGADAPWRLRPLLHTLLPEMACPLLLTAEG